MIVPIAVHCEQMSVCDPCARMLFREANMQPAPSAEFIQEYLSFTAGILISREEAEELVPLIVASRAALRRLERFDVSGVRPLIPFDPSFPVD